MSPHDDHPTVSLSSDEVALPAGDGTARVRLAAAALAVVGLGTAAGLGFAHPDRFFRSYLVAYLFYLSLALGGLFFVLLHHACRAGWSVVVRRLAEHVAATAPLFALLFLPIAFGLGHLFPWARPEAVADPHIVVKRAYLNPSFFYFRAALYFVTWAAIAGWFRRRSLGQDGSGEPAITRRLQTLAAPALVAFGVTLTFASFDWIMSLEPDWYSTIFGVYFFAGAAVAIYALLALLVLVLERSGPLTGVVTAEHLHDLGKMLFAFTVFWAYIAFSQFLLIWYGNLPEETIWFAHRLAGGWKAASACLALGHFVVPFFFLLPRDVKRNRATLAAAAIWMLAMQLFDLYWLVMPAFGGGPRPHLVDLALFVGLGGAFVAVLVSLAARPALVPVNDPRLPESLTFENM